MKESLKYGLLVVMALLLHSVTMKAVDVAKLSIEEVQEGCFLSQARPVACCAFDRFHIYYSDMPCEIGSVDMSHIPTDKSFIRYFPCFREYRATNPCSPDFQLHSSIYSLSDPVSYYVFGLRKIIL